MYSFGHCYAHHRVFPRRPKFWIQTNFSKSVVYSRWIKKFRPFSFNEYDRPKIVTFETVPCFVAATVQDEKSFALHLGTCWKYNLMKRKETLSLHWKTTFGHSFFLSWHNTNLREHSLWAYVVFDKFCATFIFIFILPNSLIEPHFPK